MLQKHVHRVLAIVRIDRPRWAGVYGGSFGLSQAVAAIGLESCRSNFLQFQLHTAPI